MDKTTLQWLEGGGAEILIETIRRYGWEIETVPADEWEFAPEVVAVADMDGQKIAMDETKDAYKQVCAVVAFFQGVCSYPGTSQEHFKRFTVDDDVRMYKHDLEDIHKFCRLVRTVSEVERCAT